MSKVVQFPSREKGDDFTARKLDWVEAVTIDSSVSAEAARLAILVAIRFLSRRSGSAFPSQKTLGHVLGITDRQVRRHMGALIEAGYIAQINRGRNKSNEYRMAFPTGHQTSSGTKRDRTSEGTGTGHLASGPGPDIGRPPNPMREPNEKNPLRGRPTAGQPTDGRSTFNVVGDTRPGGASQRICRIGSEFEIPGRGWCTVTEICPDERKAWVRFVNTGESQEVSVRPDIVFEVTEYDDDDDDEIPF